MKKVSFWLWRKLIKGLRKRGEGKRESGAFLLAKTGRNKICKIVYYDELDPQCFDSGIVQFDGAGYVPLFKMCNKKGYEVICDVHTHPSNNTSQSTSDKDNPMIKRTGHTALIIPCYAQKSFQLLNGVGIYQYQENGWLKARDFKITLF